MYKTLHPRLISLFAVGALIFLYAALSLPAWAAAPKQVVTIPSPTPGPDGRIIYIVQPNDTLLRISLLFGVTVDELRGLNNLTGDNIVVGQQLLLGLGGPSVATLAPGPSPTPTPLLPTPSSQPGTGDLCILLYNDFNGDAIRQETEPSIPDGAISINNRSGAVSQTVDTLSGLDPQCFTKLPEGEYNISVAIPSGYNATTETNYTVGLKAGDQTYLDFGAQANSATLVTAPAPSGSGRDPMLGILGGLFLVAGLGLGVYAFWWMRRAR
jgi:LysM repeat protein